MQGAAADYPAVEFAHPELLDRLVQGHQVFGEQDAARILVDKFFDPRHIGGPGATDLRLGGHDLKH